MDKYVQARLIREFEAYALVASQLDDTAALGECGNRLFNQAKAAGWDWENDDNFTVACIKATLSEVYTNAARFLIGAHIPKDGTCDHCGTRF